MGNEERNAYVKIQITNALIELLKERELSNISISDITTTAQVSRNSFYRNYSEKEDILLDHIHSILQGWRLDYENDGHQTNEEMYGSLFAHLKENSDFYLLLKKRGLFHLFLDVFLSIFGSKPDQDNLSAYIVSFIAYGTYGWIEEWIGRGMQESAESMTALLSSQGKR
ncbi:MAG: TetR/AcrR family transcriptional regulator [Paenibacillus sp.]|nr:TetR/AcrR family transcriptional regulator [Paenibacillus sp.]